mmetsp:Transcript_32365/g.72535  ORF Transcript_32365/g.72535 Transcript_32365/m.72535 type:complete len:254 (+) Transcript_32365:1078-1839(+)
MHILAIAKALADGLAQRGDPWNWGVRVVAPVERLQHRLLHALRRRIIRLTNPQRGDDILPLGLQLRCSGGLGRGLGRADTPEQGAEPSAALIEVNQVMGDPRHGTGDISDLCLGESVVLVEAVEQVERIVVGLVNEPQNRLESLRVHRSGGKLEIAQHTAGKMGDELGPGGILIVLFTRHCNHLAPLTLKELQHRGRQRPRHLLPHPDLLEHERETDPRPRPGLGAEHGVGAEDVDGVREELAQQVLRVHFDR